MTLIIFDYSGTLSMEAALFSRPERLAIELKKSGLAGLGIATSDLFWTEIVNPTWQEGSTTRIGYESIMKRSIREGLNPHVSDAVINRAVSSFVQRYLGNSVIDPQWRPILERVAGDESVCGVVATDHYAEATGYIIEHLEALGIKAVSADTADTAMPGQIYVANSADLGAHKADSRFWEKLKQTLKLEVLEDIMIVDDFGFNETTGDAYAALAKVDKRRALTEALLEDVFSAPVETVPFMIDEPDGGLEPGSMEKRIAEEISRVSYLIAGHLRAPQKP